MRRLIYYVVSFIFHFCSTMESHLYANREEVTLYVNKVGPYYNPHETYHYYTLPVCRPSVVEFKSLSLGEVLDGDRMAKSIYKINFKVNVEKATLCQLYLKQIDIERLIQSIEEFYLFEFVIDNLPIRAFIGNLEEKKMLPHTHQAQLYTHHDIQIYYEGAKIINAAILTTQNNPINLLTAKNQFLNVTFTYSVDWIKSSVTSLDHHGRPLGSRLPRTHEIHWISITNSLILVFLLLTFIMFIISRILRRDFARYNQTDLNDCEQDERGWKMVHNDVFRPPRYQVVFSAVIGTGCQLVTIALGIVIMAFLNIFNTHNHGVINIAALILYSLTSWIAGFVSCRLHKTLYNTQSLTLSSTQANFSWVRVVNTTSLMFGLPLILVWSFSNSISMFYGTTHATPPSTIVLLLLIWVLMGYPLTIAGGMLGKRTTERIDTNGCRARNIAREIPPIVWYKSKPVYLLLGGFLPFSSICIELYYIFATLWGREQYNLYGVLLIIFIILLLVTVCVSINLTYFQLVNEDYRWWWNTLQLSACSSLFIFFYCVFHYYCRSKMNGFVQTVDYFTYSILICYAFFLGLGAVSFIASLYFIRFMYRNIKLD